MDSKKDEILKRRSKLSPMQRELLEKRLRGKVDSYSRLEIIPKRSQMSPAPLSFAQQRLWFLCQLDPSNPYYNELACIQLTGALNVDAMEQSLNEIVQRHEALRTTFEMVEGQAVQIIHPTITVALQVINLRLIPERVRQAKVDQLIIQIAQKPFDLASGPLLRTILLQTGVQEYVLLFVIHHIAMDGWSKGVVYQELAILYEAFCTGKTSSLPELPIQYADFATWQRHWLQGDVLQAHLAYWKKQLGSNLLTLQLPTDRPRPAVQTFRGASQYLTLPPDLTTNLKALSQQQEATLFMTLLATFKILLHWYTSQDDIVVGTDIANRDRSEIEGLIGFFINQLVLRTNLSDNPTFQELVGRVRKVTLDAYAHQHLPFEKLVDVLKPERTLNYMPLFQVKLVLQNTPLPLLKLAGLNIRQLNSDNGTAKFDLLLNLIDTEQGLTGKLEYNTEIFDASSITRMLGHFKTLVHTVVAQPQIRLKALEEILVEADRQQQIVKQKKLREIRTQKFKNVQRRVIEQTI